MLFLCNKTCVVFAQQAKNGLDSFGYLIYNGYMMKNYSIVFSDETSKRMSLEVLAKTFDEAVMYVKKTYPNAIIESVMVAL